MNKRHCPGCGAQLSRKPGERVGQFNARRFCNRRCVGLWTAHMSAKDDTYEDLQWLLEQGVAIYDALARCGIPTGDAAFQWALRHGNSRLADLVRPAYNAERAAAKRVRRRRSKAA